jgi:hypothetical protein
LAKPDPILAWNEAMLRAIKDEHTPPPLAARNLAILHAAMYDTVNTIRRTHAPYRFRETRNVNVRPVDASAEVAATMA